MSPKSSIEISDSEKRIRKNTQLSENSKALSSNKSIKKSVSKQSSSSIDQLPANVQGIVTALEDLQEPDIELLAKNIYQSHQSKIRKFVKKIFHVDLDWLINFWPSLIDFLDRNKNKKIEIREIFSKRGITVIIIVLATLIFNPLLDLILNQMAVWFHWNSTTLEAHPLIIVLKAVSVPFIFMVTFKYITEEYNQSVKDYETEVELARIQEQEKLSAWQSQAKEIQNTFTIEKNKWAIKEAQLEGALSVKNKEIELLSQENLKLNQQNEQYRNEIFRLRGIDPNIMKDNYIERLKNTIDTLEQKVSHSSSTANNSPSHKPSTKSLFSESGE